MPHQQRAFDPHQHGHVDSDGVIWLHAPEGHVRVAQWAAGDPEAGLQLYGRKYQDLIVELDLALVRLRDGRATPDVTEAIAKRLRESIDARQYVGNFSDLEAEHARLVAAIAERRAVVAEERAKQKELALAEREKIVLEAESLAESTAWKATSDRFRALLEEWKAIGRGDKAAEQVLWKRFSHARSAFDRRRRTHFATLDAATKESTEMKKVLIARAEALSQSTDWNATAKSFRDLMAEWKRSPRGSRANDDKLWNQFKAAQDAFFAARKAAIDAEESTLAANVPARETLTAEAEALLPISNLKAAKASLRSIQERWDKTGKVPRADKERLDRRLAKVEDAIRSAEQDSWRRSNPEARARAEATVEQFQAALDRATKARVSAEDKGDSTAAAKAQATIDSTEPLLAAAQRALDEFSA